MQLVKASVPGHIEWMCMCVWWITWLFFLLISVTWKQCHWRDSRKWTWLTSRNQSGDGWKKKRLDLIPTIAWSRKPRTIMIRARRAMTIQAHWMKSPLWRIDDYVVCTIWKEKNDFELPFVINILYWSKNLVNKIQCLRLHVISNAFANHVSVTSGKPEVHHIISQLKKYNLKNVSL